MIGLEGGRSSARKCRCGRDRESEREARESQHLGETRRTTKKKRETWGFLARLRSSARRNPSEPIKTNDSTRAWRYATRCLTEQRGRPTSAIAGERTLSRPAGQVVAFGRFRSARALPELCKALYLPAVVRRGPFSSERPAVISHVPESRRALAPNSARSP
jgi:hypothetical protein